MSLVTAANAAYLVAALLFILAGLPRPAYRPTVVLVLDHDRHRPDAGRHRGRHDAHAACEMPEPSLSCIRGAAGWVTWSPELPAPHPPRRGSERDLHRSITSFAMSAPLVLPTDQRWHRRSCDVASPGLVLTSSPSPWRYTCGGGMPACSTRTRCRRARLPARTCRVVGPRLHPAHHVPSPSSWAAIDL